MRDPIRWGAYDDAPYGRVRSHGVTAPGLRVRATRTSSRIRDGSQAATMCSHWAETQRTPELRFSATLGEEPEIELAQV